MTEYDIGAHMSMVVYTLVGVSLVDEQIGTNTNVPVRNICIVLV